ncbi:BNR repeat domain protein [Labilithrix luteola]|uniref:BNR repeat domain protein n=1 Tax=Labilithrix luteola TaxID=1391654 RepID=A0A0K1QD36_9BACT|nr:Ig-like domain-containing protein [Labilithrix luteola]AKV03696.1 BNR repeat domain protein [Labilithrix luteola]
MRLTPVCLVLGSLLSLSVVVACNDDDTASDVSSTDETPDSGVNTTPSTSRDAGTANDSEAPTEKDSGTGQDAAPADETSPTLEILSPREDRVIDERVVVVTGTAKDDVGVTSLSYIVGAGVPVTVPVDADGTFSFTFVPTPGANTVELTAKDAAGNEVKAIRSAYYGRRVATGNAQGALLEDGKLFTWGRNELGQLGNGTLVGTWSSDENVILPKMYEQAAPDLVSVVSRQTFMIALAKGGTVRTWGANDTGQLGYDTPADCGAKLNTACGRAPATVPGISDAVAVAAGFNHSLVLRADGTVLAFGSNSKGQLGISEGTGTNVPTPVRGLTNVIAISAGSAHSVALTADGKVWVWGSNANGQSGAGAADALSHPTPTEVPGVVGASIASSNYAVFVKKADGTVVAWGQNNNGQLGNGTTTDAALPAPVLVSLATETSVAVPLTKVESLWADAFTCIAVDTDGNVHGWGANSLGQLAQGLLADGKPDKVNRSLAVPITVPNTDKPSFIVLELVVGAGGAVFARTTQDKVFGWGWSFQGSLGGGSTLINAWPYTTPRQIYPVL